MVVAERLSVFVSHSKSDREGLLFLNTVYNLKESQYRPILYSVEGPVAPHAKSILEHLQTASALVVLLSRDMADRHHTRSWVGFEVGAAAQRGIPILVIEPAGESPISLPVPGVTHFIHRPLTVEGLAKTAWMEVARGSFAEVAEEPWNAQGERAGTRFVAWLYNLSLTTKSLGGSFSVFVCSNAACRARYFVEDAVLRTPFTCPSCREQTMTASVALQKGLLELSERLQRQTEADERRRKLPHG